MRLVSWCFEPSQPPRIISGLKTNFNLSPIYSAQKSPNHKFSKIYKISPDTNLYKTKHTYAYIKHTVLEELVPSVLPLLKKKKKKAHEARTRCYRGPFRRFINTKLDKNEKEVIKDRRMGHRFFIQ